MCLPLALEAHAEYLPCHRASAVFAHSQRSGKEKWEWSDANQFLPPVPEFGYLSGPESTRKCRVPLSNDAERFRPMGEERLGEKTPPSGV